MAIAKLLTLLCALLLVALSHAAAFGAQASQASLVKAWEEVQRNDPETVTFEKTGEGRYKFKTNRFPFEGELKVLKANVNDYSYGDEDDDSPATNSVTGVIEYDLVGLSEEVSKKYAHSIEDWEESNTLYFDKQGGAWLSQEEQRVKTRAKYKETLTAQQRKQQQEQQQQRQQQEESNKSYNLWISFAFWWGPVVALIAVWVWFFKRTGFRRHREYMNACVTHMQRQDELLERIAEALEKRGAGAYARTDAGEYRSQPPV